MTMERKLVDVGHRVETEPGVASDITHAVAGTGEVGRTMGAEFGEAYQALKNGCGRGWQRMQDQTDEVIAHARKEPVIAMTAAASFGFLLGLAAMAIGSRGGAGGGRSWQSFLGRRNTPGWRGVLRHL